MSTRYAIVYRVYDDRETAFYAWLGITLVLSTIYLNGWLPLLPRSPWHAAASGAGGCIVLKLRLALGISVTGDFIGVDYLIFAR